MILIRRLWLFIAVALIVIIYLFLWSPSGRKDDGPVPYAYPGNAADGKLHWKPRVEKYPVGSYINLPPGPSKSIPRIQHDFSSQPETDEVKTIREERQTAVKEAFTHAWHGYRRAAWGKDEVLPLTGAFRSSFGGWGATLIDAMDTLHIMGMHEDFQEAVEVALQIDFTTNTEETLNIFETTIRYLGGLLAAYDLSGNKNILRKAHQLGDVLYTAFDTENRMPVCRWNWRKTAIGGWVQPSESTLLAELGSMTVEFTRLSQITGDMKYFDAIQRITMELKNAQDKTKLPGLWPTIVDAKNLKFDYNHFTLGGMSDSTYEYLPKQYMMLGGQDEQYKDMYEKAIAIAQAYLFFRPMVPTNENLLYSGNAAMSSKDELHLDPQGQHLTCFVGGMMAVGSKIFNRPSELDIARRLTEGCIWAYNTIPSGLMPETFHLIPCSVGSTTEVTPADKCTWNEDKWYQAIAERHPSIILDEDKHLPLVEQGKLIANKKTILPGFTDHGDNRYILRPEAIESVFIMYRITGNTTYQDIAWKMFQSIEKATRTNIAHAAVLDVRLKTPQQSDRMESFWLAETLKYFYLIFSEPTLISLDEWVLNTEAHPFRRPT